MAAARPEGSRATLSLIERPLMRWLLTRAVALYLRLVRLTNRISYVNDGRVLGREERHRRFNALRPAIMVAWHANILALALAVEEGTGDFVVLTSPHADGLWAADIVHAMGYRTITGTGRSYRQSEGTGGMEAMRAMMDELAAGRSVFLAAEVPPTRGRQVSPGVVALARLSGRPIVTISAATSRRTIVERLWDKLQINHPFGRAVLIYDGLMAVDDTLTNEEARDRLKAMLDQNYAEALRRADEKPAG